MNFKKTLFLFLSLVLIPAGSFPNQKHHFLSPNTQIKLPQSNGKKLQQQDKIIYVAFESRLQEILSNSEEIKQKFEQLSEIKPFGFSEKENQLIKAGWNRVDWDSFAQQFITALETAKKKILKGELEIFIHQMGGSPILNPNDKGKERAYPIWGKGITKNRKNKEIHITQSFLNKTRINWLEQNTLFHEVLFYYSIEKEVKEILTSFNTDAEVLTRPILLFLSTLLHYSDQVLPMERSPISKIQEESILYAWQKEWKHYLKTISKQNPLDPKQAEYFFSQDYKKVSDTFNKLFPDKESLEKKLEEFKTKLDLMEEYAFYFNLLAGNSFSEQTREKIPFIQSDIPSNVDRDDIVRLLLSKWETLLKSEAKELPKEKTKELFQDQNSLSHYYWLKREKDSDLFIKIPKSTDAAELLELENNISGHIHKDPKRPKYFVGFYPGRHILKVGQNTQIALVMDYLDGFEPLESLILDKMIQKTALSKKQIISIMEQIFEAFIYLKKEKILVRDVKPGNILVKEDPVTQSVEVKIIDLSSHFENETPFNKETIIGTPFSLAPEEAHISNYTVEQDLYKLGVILYFMLSNNMFPYREEGVLYNKTEMVLIALAENPLNKLNTDYSDVQLRALSIMANKMLQRDIKERYQSIEEVYNRFIKIKSLKEEVFALPPSLRTEISL